MFLQTQRSARLAPVLVGGAGLLLALMVAANAFFLANLHTTTLRSAERDLVRHSLTLAAQADRTFQSLDLVLSSIEEHIDRIAPAKELGMSPAVTGLQMHEFLKEKIVGLPQVEAITIIDPTGKLLNFSRYYPIPDVNVSDRDYFKALSTDPNLTTYFSTPVQNRGSGTWNVYMARRLSTETGAFRGLVLGAMSLQHFEDFYRASSQGSGSAVSLVRHDGTLLVRYPRTDRVGSTLGQTARLTTARSNVIRAKSSIDGEERLVSSHALASYPLFVVASQTEESIFASWRQMVRVSLAMMVGAAVAVAGAAFAFIRWQSQRDAFLRAASEQAEAEKARAIAEAELLRERERASEAASRAKSSFLAVMSHEIRTPMNAVLGLASTLLTSDLKPEDHEAVKAIHDAGDNLLEILNDILDYSKLEAGELSFEKVAFNPTAIVESPLAILSPRALGKGILLCTEIDPGLPPSLVGDAGRLRQVMLNMLSNAVKFTERGSVTAAVRCLSRQDGRAIIECEVRDTGIGIAPDQVGKLFSDFVQADSSINRRFGGSGLGLAICKRIIEQMNGTISVTSELGKGTTVRFAVSLEVCDAPVAADALGQDEEEALILHAARLGRPLRFLVVDDNATNRLVASRMLRALRAQVDVACDGTEAVAAAASFSYDFILMDMRMSEMDGIEATRVIRTQAGPSRSAPIIALTANAFAEDIAACIAAGMNDFVAKPVRKKVLLGAVLRQLNSRCAAAPGKAPAGEAGSQRPLFDPEAYGELEQEIGSDAMHDAVIEFVTEAKARVSALKSLSDGNDRATLRREGHSLKGMSSQFGLMRLSRAAADLEAQSETLAPADLPAAISEIERLLDLSLDSLPATLEVAE